MPNPVRQSPLSETNGPTEAVDLRGLLHMEDPDRPQTLKIKDIRRDPALQPRAALSEDVAQDYADDMKAGKVFPPGLVYDDGDVRWLVDGWHRVRAVEINQGTEFEFVVRKGNRRDALQHSLGINDKHGLRRSNEDKRRAVQTALADPEWGEMSSVQIARLCAVSATFVDNCRRSIPTVGVERKSRKKKTEIRKTSDGRTIKVKKQAVKATAKSRAPIPKPEHKPTVEELPEYIVQHLTLAAQALNQLGAGDWAESVFSFIEQVKDELAYQIGGEA